MNWQELNDIEINLSEAGSWPQGVKLTLLGVLAVAVLMVGYMFDLRGRLDELERVQGIEQQLKSDFELKYLLSSNLDANKTQMQGMQKMFGEMLRQLPSETEVAALLEEISQTGVTNGLEFELFKPGEEKQQEFYVELPIQIRVTGSYHQFGRFISDIAALPRIVTLHEIRIARREKSPLLVMDVVAKTYSYQDEGKEKTPRPASGGKG